MENHQNCTSPQYDAVNWCNMFHSQIAIPSPPNLIVLPFHDYNPNAMQDLLHPVGCCGKSALFQYRPGVWIM